MDWVAIGAAALAGAIGGLLGGLVAMPIKAKNLRTIVTVAVTVVAITVGRSVLTPYVEAEYLVRTKEIQPLVQLAPDHVADLKALFRQAYENGGTEADYAKAGFEFGKKYGKTQITDLFASRNGVLASQSFDRYMKVFQALYARNRVACFDWVEGFATSPQEMGFTPADADELAKLMADSKQVSMPQNAPLPGKLEPALQEQVTASINAHWNTQDIDLDGMSHPAKDFAPDRKAKVCYTAYAYFTEIQRLPTDQKLAYLRSIFGHS
jgi:hypothetical protein